MDKDDNNQEILLNIHSSFCKQDWIIPDEKKTSQPLPLPEQLKSICWDGLLPYLLPEVFKGTSHGQLTLWEVLQTTQSLHLRLGQYNYQPQSHHTLNPYFLAAAFAVN
ncbi:MAG: hypothetical protein RL172_596 [Bacteroidota bacterium]|jgi:hypothetical protein